MKSNRVQEAVLLALKLQPLTKLKAHNVADDTLELLARASRLSRLAEVECNTGELTDSQQASQRTNRAKIKNILGSYGLREHVTFGGDPRGYVVQIFFPDQSYNTMGGAESGWGI